MRLQEGFSFAHSTAGIINMVLEVQMKVCVEAAMFHLCCIISEVDYAGTYIFKLKWLQNVHLLWL
jgi:hypothetical protein